MYYILHKDSVFIGITVNEPIAELASIGIYAEGIDEPIPDLNNVTWDAESTSLVSHGSYQKVDFLSLFTPAEEIAISASTEPLVRYTMRLFDAATIVNISDPRTAQGLQVLQAYGLITQARMNEIQGVI